MCDSGDDDSLCSLMFMCFGLVSATLSIRRRRSRSMGVSKRSVADTSKVDGLSIGGHSERR